MLITCIIWQPRMNITWQPCGDDVIGEYITRIFLVVCQYVFSAGGGNFDSNSFPLLFKSIFCGVGF